MHATADGGYIVAGLTSSFGVGIWVLKLDASGNINWQKTYGGGSSVSYSVNSVQPTADGGYIVGGSYSLGAGGSDVLVLKLDGSGNINWQRTYGGSGSEYASSVQPTADGGYIVLSYTSSFGAGDVDVWVLKLDASGNIDWQKTYGGSRTDLSGSVQPTADGGYIVAGTTYSFGAGDHDAWVLKLDANGNIDWQKTYGSSSADHASSVHPTADGGYIVAGGTRSFGAGGYDAWVLKLDASGNINWQKTYGGSGDDGYGAGSARPTADGGYIIGGSYSLGAGGDTAWVLKLDAGGNITWQKIYSGSSGMSAEPTADSGYIVAGTTRSYGAGGADVWVLKLDANGDINGCANIGTSNVTPANSGAITGNSTATVVASSATPVSIGFTPSISTAAPLQQCYYAGPAPAANYQGLWWNAPGGSESGWGINFAHQGDTIFATWFTYDLTDKAWWLSMTANKTADKTYTGTLIQTGGPAFSAVPFDPTNVARATIGTGTLTFSDGNNGSFAYSVNGVQQTKTITRQVFGPLPTCAFTAQPNFAPATNYQDLWWVAAGAESGWGINLTHQGDNIFATWFTYDAGGAPLWLSVTAAKATPGVYAGQLIQTGGPAFNAVPFNPASVTRTVVGTATFTFANGNAAVFDYTAYGVTQTKTIARQLFAPPAGTMCQ